MKVTIPNALCIPANIRTKRKMLYRESSQIQFCIFLATHPPKTLITLPRFSRLMITGPKGPQMVPKTISVPLRCHQHWEGPWPTCCARCQPLVYSLQRHLEAERERTKDFTALKKCLNWESLDVDVSNIQFKPQYAGRFQMRACGPNICCNMMVSGA